MSVKRCMRKYPFRLACLVGLLMIIAPILVQEGHPLVGTWHGDWGPTATHRNDVTLVLDWDGKNITGLINPGPESIKLSKAALEPSSDPKGWAVHLEADAKDHDGKPVHFMIDGKIENARRFDGRSSGLGVTRM